MKKILLLIFVLSAALTLGGCKERRSLTAEGFSVITEEAGYRVESIPVSATGHWSRTYAYEPDGAFTINFDVYSTEESAVSAFRELRSDYRGSFTARASSISEKNGKIHNFYRAKNGGVYYVACRINGTVLHIVTDAENKPAVDKILKKLGYR